MRNMDSGNQVRVGQYGKSNRTCSSSSLTLHNICAIRLTGGNAYLHRPRGEVCTIASVLRGTSVSEYHRGKWEEVYLCFIESTPNQLDHLGKESPLSLKPHSSREHVCCVIEFSRY